jgi:hypothetical protein
MPSIVARLRAWKEVVWRPWVWMLLTVYGLLHLYQFRGEWLTAETQERWRLPNILPTFEWWLWAIGWLVLFLVVVLEGAYRSIRDRDHAIYRRDRAIAHRTASEPNLEVAFNPKCGGCYDHSGTQVCLGVWNKGQAAEDVHVYLTSITPGPTIGKLELFWYGEGPVGRRINTSIRSGHHHVHLLFGSVRGPYTWAVNTSSGSLTEARPCVAEILVEGRNLRPVMARVEIDPSKKVGPPIVGVSMVASLFEPTITPHR